MICRQCGKVISEEWRSESGQRKAPLLYCSLSCSNKRKHTPEAKERIRQAILNFHNEHPKEANPYKNKRVSPFIREEGATSILHLSKRTAVKIMKRLHLPCSHCGWYVEGVSLDIHHIISVKMGGNDRHSNLTYVCPNCHRLAHSSKISILDLVSLEKQMGDSWKKHYFITANGSVKEKGDVPHGGL